jgi:5-formyltetrahydrofolate cyclo-ligase
MPETTFDKTALRRALIAARDALSPDDRASADAQIGMRVLAWLASVLPMTPVTLGVYWPMRGEPDLRELYDRLGRQGVRLALPVVVQPQAPLRFAAWMPGEPMARDACGLPVPTKAEMVEPEGLLVPCVGFTAGNIRLGYGGGYYDRTLAQRPRLRTAGIAYACAITEFPRAAHDIALDTVITENSPLVFPPQSD